MNPEPPGDDVLGHGSNRRRRLKTSKVVQTGLHGSQSSRGSGAQTTRRSDGADSVGKHRSQRYANREMLDALDGTQRAKESGTAAFGGLDGFKQLDDVIGGLLRENRVGDALMYLRKLGRMVEDICQQLEPRAGGGMGSTMSIGSTGNLPPISPRTSAAATSARERVQAPTIRAQHGALHVPEEPEEVLAARRDAKWRERRFKQQESNSLQLREQLAGKDREITGLQGRIAELDQLATSEQQRADQLQNAASQKDTLHKRKQHEARQREELLEKEIDILSRRQDEMAGIVRFQPTDDDHMAVQLGEMRGDMLQDKKDKADKEWEHKILELADAQQTIDQLAEKLGRSETKVRTTCRRTQQRCAVLIAHWCTSQIRFLQMKVSGFEQQAGMLAELAERNKEGKERVKTLKQQLG
jgi:hypothetical protein